MAKMVLRSWCFFSGGLLLDSVTHQERHQTKDYHKASIHPSEASISLSSRVRVSDSNQPGVDVAKIARENGVAHNIIFKYLRMW